MGLRNVFQNGAKTVMTALGDVPVSANYHVHSSTTYNASAGTNATAYTTVGGVSVVIDVFKFTKTYGENPRERDTIDQSETRTLYVAAKDISAVTPSPKDRVITATDTWNVVTVKTDPAEALWELGVRKT